MLLILEYISISNQILQQLNKTLRGCNCINCVINTQINVHFQLTLIYSNLTQHYEAVTE